MPRKRHQLNSPWLLQRNGLWEKTLDFKPAAKEEEEEEEQEEEEKTSLQFLQPVFKFYQHVLDPHFQIRKDVYFFMVTCDAIILLVSLFGFSSFGVSSLNHQKDFTFLFQKKYYKKKTKKTNHSQDLNLSLINSNLVTWGSSRVKGPSRRTVDQVPFISLEYYRGMRVYGFIVLLNNTVKIITL